MKFNLRNRPRLKDKPNYAQCYWDTEKWFEGFRRELEEMMEKDKDGAKPLFTETAILIKRILGT